MLTGKHCTAAFELCRPVLRLLLTFADEEAQLDKDALDE